MRCAGACRPEHGLVAKLDPRRVAAFLADPPGDCRVVLLIGDDAGLVNERAGQLVRSVSADDALRVVEPGREAAKDAGSLAGEAASVPLTGGRVAIRLREAAARVLQASASRL